jgi:hypothetical protein
MISLDPWYFLIAFCIGMFVAYISTPSPEVIIKFPTPDNAGKIIYKDSANVCYKYKASKVSCPKDKSKIKEIPLQHINIADKEGEGIFYTLGKKLSY